MSNDLNLDPINRALLGKRFDQWIDIVDKMREDRYTQIVESASSSFSQTKTAEREVSEEHEKLPFRWGESKL